MAWKKIKINVEGDRYNSKSKIQGDDIIEHVFFDPTKMFSFEKYFQIHVKSHEIDSTELYSVPEWRK